MDVTEDPVTIRKHNRIDIDLPGSTGIESQMKKIKLNRVNGSNATDPIDNCSRKRPMEISPHISISSVPVSILNSFCY